MGADRGHWRSHFYAMANAFAENPLELIAGQNLAIDRGRGDESFP